MSRLTTFVMLTFLTALAAAQEPVPPAPSPAAIERAEQAQRARDKAKAAALAHELESIGKEILKARAQETAHEKAETPPPAPKSEPQPAAESSATPAPPVAAPAAPQRSPVAAAEPAPTAVAQAPPAVPAVAADVTPPTVDLEMPSEADVGNLVYIQIRESGQPVRERHVVITPRPDDKNLDIENDGLVWKFCGKPGTYRVRVVSIGSTRGYAECEKTVTIKNPYLAEAIRQDREERREPQREAARPAASNPAGNLVDVNNPVSTMERLLAAVSSPNKTAEAARLAVVFRREATVAAAVAESRLALDEVGGSKMAWQPFLSGVRELVDGMHAKGLMASDADLTSTQKETNALRRIAQELDKTSRPTL